MTFAEPGVVSSHRFLEHYYRASVPLQHLIEHAVQDFIRRYRANPKTVAAAYDRVAGLRPPVLKLDVAGGHRLLARWSTPKLLLLDVGDHEVTKRYTVTHLRHDLDAGEEAPIVFNPERGSRFFETNPDRSFAVFGPELTSDWLYFLSDPQSETLEAILSMLLDAASGRKRTAFVIGGPGTGKTSILLNLLKWVVDFEIRVQIELSDALTAYVEASLGIDMERFREVPAPLVRLVDDPSSGAEVRSASRHAMGEMLTVIAFDPCQLYDALPDAVFDETVSRAKAQIFRLQVSYRQKRNVGEVAKHAAEMIADSTPYLRKDRREEYSSMHATLTSLANDLEFPNPHGYVQVYEAPNSENLAVEIARIKSHPLWKHWPGVLAVIDEGVSLPDTWAALLEQVGARQVGLADVEQIKGLEFQHVLLVINEDLYHQTNAGFRGSGKPEYLARRLLRIPFSRGKDSLVTFVAPAVAQR